jgi:energy-coupling factor transport system ATP-binding protein
MAVIELKDVTFKYQLAKETILENISFSIEKGEFVALVGRNGVGKTTLCSIMRGLIPTFHTGTMSGQVLLNGLDISDMSIGDIALHVGFVFQNPFVQVSGVKQTVFEEVAYGLENLGVERSEIIRRVEEMLHSTEYRSSAFQASDATFRWSKSASCVSFGSGNGSGDIDHR